METKYIGYNPKCEGSFILHSPEDKEVTPHIYLKQSDQNNHLTPEHRKAIENILFNKVGMFGNGINNRIFDLTRINPINPLLYTVYAAGWKAKKHHVKAKMGLQKPWYKKQPYTTIIWTSLSLSTILAIGYYTSFLKISYPYQ